MAKYGSLRLPRHADGEVGDLCAAGRRRPGAGVISLIDMEREHAFSDSDVRLLQTLANSMSVALENARLFDETQRLLKETEQRAAELAVINSIQEGMAAELDFQAIIDLVGDKLREVFNTGDIGIRWYDAKTEPAPLSCTSTSTAMRAQHRPPAAAGRRGVVARSSKTRQPLVDEHRVPRRRR